MTNLHWPATAPRNWNARWIAPAFTQSGSAFYFRARKSFVLEHLPARAFVHIAADSIYHLFVNGQLICRGPVRGNAHTHYIDTCNIAPYLRTGQNWIALLIYTPASATFKHAPLRPGVLVQSDDLSIATDATWQVQQADEYRTDVPLFTFQIGAIEWKDMRHVPTGWQTGDDGGQWQLPADSPSATADKQLLPRDIPALAEAQWLPADVPMIALTPSLDDANDTTIAERMTNELHRQLDAPINPSPLLMASGDPIVIHPPADGSGVVFVVDYARTVNGKFELDIDAPAGTIVDIGYEEALRNGRLYLMMYSYRFADRYILRDGRQTIGNEFAERGYRMVQIVIRNFTRPVLLYSATATDCVYPYISRGSFTSNDAMLNQLWTTCDATLRACTTDTLVDCPWRENACYLNDMAVEVPTSYQAFGDERVLARSIRLAAQQQRPHDGLLPVVVPFGQIAGMSPQQSADHLVLTAGNLTFPLLLEEYLLYTGDRALATEMAEKLPAMLNTFASWEDADGIATPPKHHWNFIDWSYPTQLQNRASATIEWLRVLALDATARLTRMLWPERPIDDFTNKAARLASAIDGRFWNGSCYVEGISTAAPSTAVAAESDSATPLVTELAQSLAILSDRLSVARAQQLAGSIVAGKWRAPDLFMHHYVLRALTAAGQANAAIERIRTWWGPIVHSGSPTIWEIGVHDKGKAAFGGAGSLCHGFATTPIDFMQSTLLGIRPTAIGYSRACFIPQALDLSNAAGRIPTPHGNIHVAWQKAGSSIEASLIIPHGTLVDACHQTLSTGHHQLTIPCK